MKIDYVTLFCFVDDFCKGFEPWYKKQLISDGTLKRDRRGHLLLSEIMTILISYHQSGMACFKYFYLSLLQNNHSLFPGLVHYDRFVKLIKKAFPAFVCLLKSLTGEITEYLFIDSTPMAVCHTLREKNTRRSKGWQQKEKPQQDGSSDSSST